MKPEVVLGIVVLVLGSLAAGFLLLGAGGEMSVRDPFARPYVEIENPSGFLNTGINPDGTHRPITIGELVGKKVILIDFMTYSCINCQRTLPHMVAWYEAYKDSGLEIVAIHTPEFAFERDIDNVRAALLERGILYPVVLDNDYATWHAFGNNYWPRKYLIDIDGSIVYDHIGEGAYEETEAKIRELLRARASRLHEDISLGDPVESNVPDVTVEARSPETYFGSDRNEYFRSGLPGRSGTQSFDAPVSPSSNSLYLSGTWDIQAEYAEASANARITYRYNAKHVYLVATSEKPLRLRVLQDGVPVRRMGDVDEDGFVTIREDRLYHLIQNAEAGSHLLEIEVPAEVRVFAFTFG